MLNGQMFEHFTESILQYFTINIKKNAFYFVSQKWFGYGSMPERKKNVLFDILKLNMNQNTAVGFTFLQMDYIAMKTR